MRKILFVILLGIAAVSVSAQNDFTLVMKHVWNMDTKTNEVISESKCEDGIEFFFETKKAYYYTPNEQITEALCRIVKIGEPIVNEDKSTSYEYQLYKVGAEKSVDCVLNISEDMKTIRFTMIESGKAKVYLVSNMMTEGAD